MWKNPRDKIPASKQQMQMKRDYLLQRFKYEYDLYSYSYIISMSERV
jgi:hypothetical protein